MCAKTFKMLNRLGLKLHSYRSHRHGARDDQETAHIHEEPIM